MAFPTNEKDLRTLLDNMKSQNAPKNEMKLVVDTFIQRQSQSTAADIPEPKRGVAEVATEELANQGKGIVGAAKSLFQKGNEIAQMSGPAAPFEIAKAGVMGVAKGLGKKALETGEDLAKGAVESVKSLPDALEGAAKVKATLIDRLLQGESIVEALKGPGILTEEEVAKLDKASTDSIKGVSGVADFIPTPQGQFAAGLAGEVSKAKADGEDIREAGIRGVIKGGERAALVKLIESAMKSKEVTSKSSAEGVQAKARLTKPQIKAASEQAKIDPIRGEKLVRAGKEAAKDNLAPKPMEIVGEKVSGFQKDLNSMKGSIGKKIGAYKDKMADTGGYIPTKSVKETLKKTITGRKMGVQVMKDGKLDFSDSIFKNSAADQKFISGLWDEAAKTRVNPESILRRLDRIASDLYQGKAKLDFSDSVDVVAEVARKAYRSSIDDFAKANDMKELLSLNKQYSEISSLSDDLAKAISKEGIKAPQVIRRAFGGASSVPRELISKIDDIAAKYGLDSGKNILNEADFALTVEQVAGVKAPTGLAIKDIPVSKAGVVSKAADFAADKLMGEPEDILLNILKNPATTSQTVKPLLRKLVESAAQTEAGKEAASQLIKIGLLSSLPG